LGEWRYSSTHSLTSALDGGEWSASCPGRFTPKEIAPDTYWIGGWKLSFNGAGAVPFFYDTEVKFVKLVSLL
jgi:hypothetical protein